MWPITDPWIWYICFISFSLLIVTPEPYLNPLPFSYMLYFYIHTKSFTYVYGCYNTSGMMTCYARSVNSFRLVLHKREHVRIYHDLWSFACCAYTFFYILLCSSFKWGRMLNIKKNSTLMCIYICHKCV